MAEKKGRKNRRKAVFIDKNRMISTDVLKIIAVVTMFIDHIGAGILENWLVYHFEGSSELYNTVYAVDMAVRCIGRVSFPLFCYLLVQGFIHTRSRARYAIRLLIFAVISELPFDYLFFNGFTMQHQNIFWTLLIALITLTLIEHLEHLDEYLVPDQKKKRTVFPIILKAVMITAVTVTGMLIAHFLGTDYSWKGILMIITIYLTRPDRLLQTILSPTVFIAAYFLEEVCTGASLGTAIAYAVETKWTVYLPFLLTWRCNGKRTMKNGKYFFYIFYPAHLIIFLIIRYLIYM